MNTNFLTQLPICFVLSILQYGIETCNPFKYWGIVAFGKYVPKGFNIVDALVNNSTKREE